MSAASSKKRHVRVAVGATRSLGSKCLVYLHDRADVIGVDPAGDEECIKTARKLNISLMRYRDIVAAKPDLFLSLKYPKIIRKDLLDTCLCVNLHTAQVPNYRGLNGFTHAIAHNEAFHGMAMLVMDEGIDTGGIIAERFIPIEMRDTAYSLLTKTYDASYKMFCEEIDSILEGTYTTRAQTGTPHYYNSELHKKLNPKDSSLELYNMIRSLDFPGCEPAYYESEWGGAYMFGSRIFLKINMIRYARGSGGNFFCNANLMS